MRASAKPVAPRKPRAAKAAPKTAAAGKPATAKPAAAAKPATPKPAAARTARRSGGANAGAKTPPAEPPRVAPRRKVPAAGYAAPDARAGEPSASAGAELISTSIQAAAELAQIGLTVGRQTLRSMLDRLPKP